MNRSTCNIGQVFYGGGEGPGICPSSPYTTTVSRFRGGVMFLATCSGVETRYTSERDSVYL